MQAEAGLVKRIVHLLQEIIIQGAEVIYAKQRKSAQGWRMAYPYSGPILGFSKVVDTLTLVPAVEIMGRGTPEGWEPPKLGQISEYLRQFSQWQGRLGKDLKENLYLIRKHLQPLAVQTLHQVSSSYGFWPRDDASSIVWVGVLSPRTTNLFSDEAKDDDELRLVDVLDAPELKALVDEFNLLMARLGRVANRQDTTSVSDQRPSKPAPKELNLFSIDGEKVSIRFEGHDLPSFNVTVGMRYLAYLVNHQGVQFETPLDLENAVMGIQPGHGETSLEVTIQSAGKLGFETAEQTRMDKSPRGYLSQLGDSLKEINKQILEAEASENHAKYEDLEHQKDLLVKAIKEQKVLSRRSTRLAPESKKVKNRLWNAIDYAIEIIEETEGGAALGAHFRKALKPFSFPYNYDPQPPIHWRG